MSIKENLRDVNTQIDNACKSLGVDRGNVELLAVSKTKPIEYLLEAYDAGQRLFGENRVNEAELKVPSLPNDAIFHMIGHLQSNKVKKACFYFNCIQSVDSLKIAQKIDSCCSSLGKIMDVYLEVNVANDSNKSGFIIEDSFYMDFELILGLKNLKVVGLMCIGAYVSDKVEIKRSFNKLKNLSLELMKKYKNFKGDKLSMGMSSDFEEALEEGSTMVRIGSNIFGNRN